MVSRFASGINSGANRIGRTALVAIIGSIFALNLSSCKEGVTAGSVEADFAGVSTVKAISPTAVKITWLKNTRYNEYKIFANYQVDPVSTRVFEDVTIDNLTPTSTYSFKVVGVSAGSQAGGNRELPVTTWARFTGPKTIKKDADGNLVLSWEYEHKGVEYYVYYRKLEDPTPASTNNWANANVITSDNTVTFKGLEGSTRYHFLVHAKYREGEFERPLTSLNGTTESTFPTPKYALAPVSIGNLPFVTIDPVINALYKQEYYTSQVYQNEEIISDPLTGKGTLVFSSSKNWQLGLIDKINLRVRYNDGSKTETLIIDGLKTYLKGLVSYLDEAPIQSVAPGPAYLGESVATGDFNCDGFKDLAIGMPRASVASLGVKNEGAGAIYIYYSTLNTSTGKYYLKTNVAPKKEPVADGDPQIITFDDLDSDANFGAALASGGNLNGDYLGVNACEDLVVGAPYHYVGVRGRGGAFVFFGSTKGLKAPAHLSDISNNVETCDGLVEKASCAAVRLYPNPNLNAVNYRVPETRQWDTSGRFASAVSFIGDFNADGYDDIAIGDPNADWDGNLQPSAPNEAGILRNAGAVYLFFGSKYGIGKETPMASTTPSASDLKFRYLKLFSPFPQENGRFGASIAGGADVDGKYQIMLANGTTAGGGDMVVGSPGFQYPDLTQGLMAMTAGNATADSARTVIPNGGGYTTNSASIDAAQYSGTTNHYNVAINNNTTTGIAFVYFGRGSDSKPTVAQTENPSRSTFWNCGRRGTPDDSSAKRTHYSCLAHKDNFRVLFPRNQYSTGFGSAVALAGDSSRYLTSNNDRTRFADPNADGFAEVVVAARYGRGLASGNANSGVLWQFYGNNARLFEGADFFRINGSTTAADWRDQGTTCVKFDTTNGTTTAASKPNCVPTQIRSNSIPGEAQLGAFAQGMTAADVTGDGIVDIVVGAPYDNTAGPAAGAVYAFTSVPANTSVTPNLGGGVSSNFMKFYLSTGDSDDNLGRAVAVGNFDGDVNTTTTPQWNYNDIAVGAPNDEEKRSAGGGVYIFNSGGLSLPAIKQSADISIFDELASPQDYGYSYSRLVGDINGDGFDDAFARTSRFDSSGQLTHDLVIYFGSPMGLVTTTFCQKNVARVFKSGMGTVSECFPATNHATGITADNVTLPQLVIKPNNVTSRWAKYGYSAGDINGDGFGDIILSDDSGGGSAIVYYGTRGGLQAIISPSWTPAANDPQFITKLLPSGEYTTGTLRLLWLQNYRPFSVGDFNGDGYGDIVIARPFADGPAMNTGSDVTPSSVTTSGPGIANSGAAGTGWRCVQTSTSLGNCTSGRGAYNSGQVMIVYGSARGVQTPSLLGTATSGTDFSTTTGTMMSGYGTEVAANPKVCDGAAVNTCKGELIRNPVHVNIDYGYDKFHHYFGANVVIMDYDKDGYDDMLVGAPGFQDTRCWDDGSFPRSYGRVYMYKGSKNGVLAAVATEYYEAYNAAASCPVGDATTAGDKALGTARTGNNTLRALQPTIVNYGVGNNFTGRNFGIRMSNAGDLNGDGYEDLVVSTPNEDVAGFTDNGGNYVYYGPLCGTDNDGVVMNAIQLEANLNKQKQFTDPSFGAVSINPSCSRPSGVKPAPQKFSVLGAINDDHYGMTVLGGRKGSGDVNGDGYDDILIGTSQWDNPLTGQSNIGRGVVFFGSAKGIYTDDYPGSSVVTQDDLTIKPFFMVDKYADGNDQLFFDGNASVGDVNGDGTMDFMIPSYYYDGSGVSQGINMGTFMLFY